MWDIPPPSPAATTSSYMDDAAYKRVKESDCMWKMVFLALCGEGSNPLDDSLCLSLCRQEESAGDWKNTVEGGEKKDRSRQTEAECSCQIVGYFLSSTTVPYRSGWLDPVLLFPGNPLSVASYNVDESAYRQAVCERLAAERIYCTLAAQCKVFCVCTFHNPASIYRISGQLLGDVCSFAFDQRALQKHISCHTFSHKHTHTQSSLLQRGGNWVAVQFFSFFLTLSHHT